MMIKLTQEELNKKIRKHRLWLESAEGGKKLAGAYDLRGSNLRGSNLSNSDLSGSDLSYCNLSYCNLHHSDLSYCDLSYCDLSYSDLSYSDLNGSDLNGSDFRGVSHIPFVPIACPTHGEFIAWKKVKNKIVKLKIPKDAKRCSATGSKCRCDKALVLAIENIDGSDSGLNKILNENYTNCLYKVGEMVYPDSFDDNRWNECSHGIHFFIDRSEAERW